MRGEPAGALDARDVAAGAVFCRRAVHEVLQAAVGAGFSRRPGVGQPRRSSPGCAGEQAPAFERFARRQAAAAGACRARQLVRGRQRQPGLGTGQAGLPEGREDLVGPPAAGPHGPRLEHEVRLEARGADALPAGPALQAGVDGAFGPAVAAVPQQGVGRRFHREVLDDPGGRAAAEHQPRARGLQRGGQAGQGVVEPPLHRAAQRPDAGRLLIQDIDDGQGLVQGSGLRQSRIVIQPEVVTEPDKGRRHGSTVHARPPPRAPVR